ARGWPQRRARRGADCAQDPRHLAALRRSTARPHAAVIELGAIAPFLPRLRQRVLRALQRPALDLPLLGALLLLATIGLTTLYSASNLDRHLVFNQGARFVLGGALMLLIAR